MIFATKEFYEAIYIIPAITGSVYFMFLFNVFANVEYYYNETKYVAFASIGAAVTNVILNLIFIKQFGYVAAGYTTLVSYILYALGHFIFMRKICKKHAEGINYYDNKVILIISVTFVVISLLTTVLYNFRVIRYALIIIMLCFVILKRKEIIKLVIKNKTKDVNKENMIIDSEI